MELKLLYFIMIVIIMIELVILVDLLRLRYQFNNFKKMTLEKKNVRKKEVHSKPKRVKEKSKVEDYFDENDDFSSYL